MFCQFVLPTYEHARHLDELAIKLEQIESGQIKRLAVFMPPRHGKSMAISQFFPCWYFGRNPAKDIIQVGFADDISILHSRHARVFFGSERYSLVFPNVAKRLEDADIARQAIHEWTTMGGGRYKAAGILSGITGRGAHLLIIDDPVKNREEANSPALREKILQEYRSTLLTRLTPDGAIILVMTRWHRDDLAGTLMQEMQNGGEQWTVLNMPAVKDGQALWPERWGIDLLAKKRVEIGSTEFEALYQQNPLADGSGLFKREWFSKFVDVAPAECRWVRAWDMAASNSVGTSDPDWTVGAKVGIKDGVYYVTDIVRGRWTPMETEKVIKTTAELDGKAVPIRMEQEGWSGGPITIDHYARYILVGWQFGGDKPRENKVQRAGVVAAAAEAGNVRLVRGGRWVQSFIDEAELFPNGSHDDQIDAVSLAFRTLTTQGKIMLI